MAQSEHVPEKFKLTSDTSNSPSLSLSSDTNSQSYTFTFEAIRDNLFRTTFSTPTHPLPPHPSASKPSINLSQNVTSTATPTFKTITTPLATATIDYTSTPVVAITLPDATSPIHQDLPFRSYTTDGTGIAHYTRYYRHTLHLGLGEKPAPLDLSNRHFTLSATDSFGYDVHRTDPLYKHIPLLINATPTGVVGTFSTSHARGTFSVGSEMDGLWGPFKVYRQAWGGLEEYVIVGQTLQDVVRTYADLVGYPMLVPRWAFGYIAGGMKYSMLDEPRAADALMGFANKIKEFDIPCSGFQLSSGYTVAETEPKTRNVFTWNRHRFPDPKGWVDKYHAAGIRLIANVKPYVLGNHPEYEKLKEAGAFFTDPATGQSATARLWSAGGGESGVGGHLDFTSTAGYNWWYDGIRELKKVGIDCIWNDNNEWTVPNDNWRCALTEQTALQRPETAVSDQIGLWGRALNCELMGKASHDATLAVEPDQRPFVLTRSATAGTMRYCASSWSGDNVTSWDGMRGANALSLGAGMCLLQCYGHDIGGFEGPQPSAELLVRWVQQGIYSPRFAINCFKTSPENNSVGDVIEPWMYPEVTHIVRDTLRRRYELIPYIYSLALQSHLTAIPPQRWIGWGYESDSEVWSSKLLRDGETQYWFGDTLLVGGVFEPGVESARVYLPRGETFIDVHTTQVYTGGQWVDIPSKWDTSIPVLARVGGAIPVGKPVQVLSVGEKVNPAQLPADDYRGVEIFPEPGATASAWAKSVWYEDDGMSRTGHGISEFVVEYRWDEEGVEVRYQEKLNGGFVPKWEELDVLLPKGDERKVNFNGQSLKAAGKDERGRTTFKSQKLR